MAQCVRFLADDRVRAEVLPEVRRWEDLHMDDRRFPFQPASSDELEVGDLIGVPYGGDPNRPT